MINNKTKIRNILLIGNAGKGKSTLINILTETNEFEESITDIFSEDINQILFLTNGRFTKEEVKAFNLLRNVIFDDHVTDYTTIVFINFAEFKDEKACKKNRQGF
ncbi:unnamed protein product [Rhizophagus irregularis]|nr:unnamed protein product [Rhizophagus irregularis]